MFLFLLLFLCFFIPSVVLSFISSFLFIFLYFMISSFVFNNFLFIFLSLFLVFLSILFLLLSPLILISCRPFSFIPSSIASLFSVPLHSNYLFIICFTEIPEHQCNSIFPIILLIPPFAFHILFRKRNLSAFSFLFFVILSLDIW